MKLYKSYLEDPSDNIVEEKKDEVVSEEEILIESEIIPDLLVDCLLESDELSELFLDYLQEEDAKKKETKKEKFKKYLKMAGKAALIGAAGYGAYTMGTQAKAAYPGAKAATIKKAKEAKVATIKKGKEVKAGAIEKGKAIKAGAIEKGQQAAAAVKGTETYKKSQKRLVDYKKSRAASAKKKTDALALRKQLDRLAS
jgi:hypothetical protein